MKFGWNSYWKPTPKSIRKFADSLSAASLAASGIAFASDYKIVAYVVLASAFLGKFLSNFFADDNITEGSK